MKKLFLLLLCSAQIDAATYYADWDGGSDSNSGTSKGTPFKRAWWMNGFSGTYSHSAGDQWIFKGGVIWPASCFRGVISTGGSSLAVRDYYGVDATWYSGGSWTRPIFDGQSTTSAFLFIGNPSTYSPTAQYWVIDNIEFRNLYWSGAPGFQWYYFVNVCDNAQGWTIQNCYFNGWSHGTLASGTKDRAYGITAVNLYPTVSSAVISNCVFNGGSAGKDSLYCIGPFGGTVTHCTISNTANAILGGYSTSANSIDHNRLGPTYTSFDYVEPNAQHDNILNVAIGGTHFIHDNVFTGGKSVTFLQSTAGDLYFYNNVFEDCGSTAININNSSGTHAWLWNNTIASGDYTPIRIVNQGGPGITLLSLTNNHVIMNGGSIVSYDDPSAGALTVATANNPTINTTQATAEGYTLGNDYAPVSSSGSSVISGADMSGVLSGALNTDINGNARPALSKWQAGAYSLQGGSPSNPGNIYLSSATYGQSEEITPLAITVNRGPGTDGPVTVDYATADGTALDGVNYTATSGTLNWAGGDGTPQVVNVPLIDANTDGNPTFTFSLSGATGGATIVSPSSAIVTIAGSGTPATPLLSGLSWAASAGQIAAPFVASGDTISQSVQTTDPSSGGRASYTFTNVAGVYALKIAGVWTNDASNSIFVNTNGEPTSPMNIWDAPIASGLVTNYIGWRGSNGTPSVAEFPFVTWTLPAGTNSIVIRGREAGMVLSNLTLVLWQPESPPSVTAATVVQVGSGSPSNGITYYRAGQTITNTITFSDAVDVTGTPVLTNNVGGISSYDSGSGSNVLSFVATVQAGQNTQLLDYEATNSLALNGGTIRSGGVDATLTLPEPGSPGSISYGQTNVIDTIAPTTTIGAPGLLYNNGAVVGIFWPVTFTDTNFGYATLSTNDVNIVATGSASGVPIVAPPLLSTTVVQFSPLSGSGTLAFSVDAGAATDLAGNTSTASSTSSAVSLQTVTMLHSGTSYNVIIH